MKLLFDQNLSSRLCRRLSAQFPNSVHVRDIGMRDASDTTIWDYAKERGFAIITKDRDFRQRSFLHGHPPKIIWVRLGNCSTDDIERRLRKRTLEIEEFLRDEPVLVYGQKSFLVLD